MGNSEIYLHLQTFKNRVYLQIGSHALTLDVYIFILIPIQRNKSKIFGITIKGLKKWNIGEFWC